MAELNMSILLRRGTTAVLATKKPEQGEPVYDIEAKVLKIGDGTRTFAELPAINQELWTADIAEAVRVINEDLATKADKATTLAGYGITDAYTKAETEGRIQEVLEGLSDTSETAASVAADLKAYKEANDPKVDDLKTRMTSAEGDIDTIQAQLQDFDEVAGAVKAVTDALNTEVQAIKADYLKAADKTELQGNIDTVSAAVERLTNGVSADEVDSVNDLINYVNEHGTEVTGMQEDIAENAEAISGLDTKVAGIESSINAESTGILARIKALEDDTTSSTHISNTVVHITAEERSKWDKAVTDIGTVEEGKTVVGLISEVKAIAEAAQTATQVESAIDAKIVALDLGNTYATIGSVEDISDRVDAVEAASATHASAADLTAHTGNSDSHITADERTLWTSGEVSVTRLTGNLRIDGGLEE